MNEFFTIDVIEVDTNEEIIIVQTSDSTGPVQSVNGKIGFVNIDKTDIGLSNVENVSIIGVSGELRNDIENLGKDVVYTTGYQEISGYKYFVEGLDSNYISLYPYGSDDSSFLTFVNKTGGVVDLYIDNVAQYNALRIPNKDGTLLTAEELLERNVLFNSGTQIITGLKIISGQFPPPDQYSLDDIRASGSYFFVDDAERFQYYIIAPGGIDGYLRFGPYSLGELHKNQQNLFITTNAVVNSVEGLNSEISGLYPNSNPSGFITGVDLTPYATNLNLAATGSTLNTRIDNLSGTLIDEYVTKTSGQFTTRPTVNGTGVLLTEDVAEYVFPNDLIVSLSSGKTFGRYRDGDTILASGKTTSEILQLAIVEPINPDVSLTTSTPTILFNQTGISNILNANTVIKSLNSNVETGFLEWRRGGVGEWAQLTGNSLTGFTFFHTLTDSNFNTSGFNYRYIVIDTVGATNTGNSTITPVAYVSPSLSSTSVGSSPVDLGNISGTLSTTINKNSPNVNITGYQLQYQTGTNWVNIGSLTSISSTPYSLSVIHNDSNLKNITSINYRIQVYDQYQLNTLTMGSRSFLYRNYLGYSPNTILTLSEIELLSNSTLSNSKTRTISNVTAGVGNYTYYCYRGAAGDLTSIIQDGAAPVLGAFTKLSDVVGTNAYGASVTYRVYRSNATNAFTSNTLSFS